MAQAAQTQLIGIIDLQGILSDALASFSPLATLVGSDSARSLTQHVTNTKQTFVASLAPIGALGMMSSVCKGANLPGLKDMLGASDTTILDSCSDLGCGALRGIVPGMSPRGGLTTNRRENPRNTGAAACGILRASCILGDTKNGMDIGKVMAVLDSFSSATVSGRFQWIAKNSEEQWNIISDMQRVLLSAFDGTHEWDREIFDLIQTDAALKGGEATYELHWPAPAMPMETNPWIIFVFGAASVLSFLTVVVISTVRQWQTVPAAFLLVGGQAVLATGHVAAQWSLKHQRKTIYLDFPRGGFSDTWMLVDNVWFTSMLARRPLKGDSKMSHIKIGQYLEMKNMYIPTWQAILTLSAIGIGFIGFYVGAKSSNVYTILVYIVLFLVVNMAKGSIVTRANRAEFIHLNNPGFRNLLVNETSSTVRQSWWRIFRHKVNSTAAADQGLGEDSTEAGQVLEMADLPEFKGPAIHESSASSSRHTLSNDHPGLDPLSSGSQSENGYVNPRNVPRSLSRSSHHSSRVSWQHGHFNPINIPLPPSLSSHLSYQAASEEEGYSEALIPLPPSKASTISGMRIDNLKVQHRVFAKMAVRHTLAMGMFYFSRGHSWGMAAHMIHDACKAHVAWQWPPNLREPFMYLPLGYYTNSGEFVDGGLVLAIDETRHEDLFWRAGMEFMSILLDNFLSDSQLVSELPGSTSLELLGSYVYHITKFLLSTGEDPGQGSPGRGRIMRAIDLVKIKYPYDDTDVTVPTLRAYAQAASRV